MQRLILPYKDIKAYINEGDVLLFQGAGWISHIIASQSDTTYSHVGVASWVNGDSNTQYGQLDCVEFREGYGGRAVNLETQVKKYPQRIDVYRPVPSYTSLVFDSVTRTVITMTKNFNGKEVTRVMRRLTGLPYGWSRIWWLIKNKLVFFRFLSKEALMSDKILDIVYPVCSTAVAYAFNVNEFDLINNKSDEYTEPGHIAMSPRLNYLFTLDSGD